MDKSRVDLLLQYILATAGQQDFGDQELGPIHLIKYVYLADLAYSERNDGQTFTGAPWSFHHFGPWCTEVFARIEPVVDAMGALKRTIPNFKYESDSVRYHLQDDELQEATDDQLPVEITVPLKRAIRQYSNDTSSLLHFVYGTKPMIMASPGEFLKFAGGGERLGRDVQAESPGEPRPPLGKKKIAELKERIRARLAEKKAGELIPPSPPPRYDEVYFGGLKWLDSLAGPQVDPSKGELRFSNDIWESPSRTDEEIP